MSITKYYLVILAVGFIASLSACQKVIDVKANTSPSQIVIEGDLTDVRGIQYIKINQSVAYTETNTYPAVTGADVRITDNLGNTWKFSETQPGLYAFNNLRGIAGRTYTLNVKNGEQSYIAVSAMPARVPLDSIHIRDITFGNDTHKIIVAYYNDPKDIANQYRYVMRINGVLSRSIYADDDRLTNGNAIQENLYPQNDDNDFLDINPGDQIEVEMQCIDKDVFKYWYTLRQQYRGGPGGGTAPGNPPSNISNHALGYFSAHTTQTKKIIAK
ncbi:DUF4249 domain-containing protein [Mucilaginibacter sp. Bleaf8]|uniref:DUF4249 domain-containing protein n=1 Tax=Mucilaginibacter sp. Bleaf8 TaxID=2834430 RepID=UPI001BCBAD9B|nr:DUF4249 domain-containing protein [Mucilaginibacter sp. Bleaf8]MBS7563180.1 DUF4249 domain-containing protein [Mucilaginibacter sp. Bleaf8]